MALIPASIDITFNANYTGCHRICWRPEGAPDYDCSTEVTCTGNGNPCSASIGIQVDNAGCLPQTFEGYVQACCEDPLSLNGRIPFTVVFSPNPDCLGYTITCDGPVSINNVVVTDPGSGYVPGASIPVTFVPALGGIAANAIIGDGGVSSSFGSAAPFPFGSGYVDGTYTSVPAVTLTGVGSGALFTVTVLSGQVISAEVQVNSNGINYAPGDTITFNNANLGGSGSGVVVTIYTVNTGEVQGVTIVNPGSGYTTPPVATIPSGATGQATLGVALATCDPLDFTTCGPAPYVPITPGLPVGASFVACLPSAPGFVPVGYTVTQDQCCNECTTISFDKPFDQDYNNPPATIYYTCCETKNIVSVTLAMGGNYGPVCAVTGSWFVVESDPVNGVTSISTGGTCTGGACS
jgi:hypothetical protein